MSVIVTRSNLGTRVVNRTLVAVSAAILVIGLFGENPTAFLLIAAATILPAVLWIRSGAKGIPVLPAVAMLFFVYYAVPVFRGATGSYTAFEVDFAAVTVCCFLASATLSWWILLKCRLTRRGESATESGNIRQTKFLIFMGLMTGIAYYALAMSNLLGWIGTYVGAVRSIMLTFCGVSCFLLGYARGKRILKGPRWLSAMILFGILVALACSNLFLVGGATHVLAAILGYVITTKRIPWGSLGVTLIVVTVLHAGKSELRSHYWASDVRVTGTYSIVETPSLIAAWFGAGIANLMSGKVDESVAVDRASLIHMLMLVQRATPEYVPYLEGETYAFLVSTLVPRFIDPDKATSQSGLNYLSVRYGLQSPEATSRTTIAWGTVAEAYANFGFFGVIGIGILYGVLCGWFTQWSLGASPVSLRTLATIVIMVNVLNVEADLGYLTLTIIQSLVSIVVAFFGVNVLRALLGQIGRETRLRLDAPRRLLR